MAKTIDITDKLSFDENPKMIIAGNEIEVNADAEVMIRLMGLFKSGINDMAAIGNALSLIFSEEDMNKICSVRKNGKKLSARSLMDIIEEATNLIMGEEAPGEQ